DLRHAELADDHIDGAEFWPRADGPALLPREEIGPHRPPLLAERPEIFGTDFVAFGIGRRQYPRLRASHEHVRGWNKPFSVVERSSANIYRLRTPDPFAVNSAAAVAAKPRRDVRATRGRTAPSLWLALQDIKILCQNRHVQRECAAGRRLAICAIAGVEQQRKRCDA